MSRVVTWQEAEALLGPAALGPEAVAHVFGPDAVPREIPPLPFSHAELEDARTAGEMLVLRTDRLAPGVPLTILALIERVPQAFDPRRLRQVGYQLKEEWGIALEPLAATETCTPGWSLTAKAVLPESCNRSFEEQTEVLARYARSRNLAPDRVGRRTAVEAVYDTVLHFAAGRGRLLERTWDWTRSRTLDGGLLNVGGFGPQGLQILSYSPGIRHGALGVCPTRGAAR